MACFLVPAAEAVVVTIAAKSAKAKEDALLPPEGGGAAAGEEALRASRKLGWLAKLLWGGAFLLAYEHVWHGEVVPYFPFLTAAADPAEAAEMLYELATAGVLMAALVTAVWFAAVRAARGLLRRGPAPEGGRP